MGTLRLSDLSEVTVRAWAREERRPITYVLDDLVALGAKQRGDFDLAERLTNRTNKRPPAAGGPVEGEAKPKGTVENGGS